MNRVQAGYKITSSEAKNEESTKLMPRYESNCALHHKIIILVIPQYSQTQKVLFVFGYYTVYAFNWFLFFFLIKITINKICLNLPLYLYINK